LSGFLISATVLRDLEGNRWNFGNFAFNRLTRLYVVLIPALLIGALWDYAGIASYGKRNLYSTFNETWSVLVGNAVFLQRIAVPTFGSNSSLWSLSYEFWYYMVFPSIVLIAVGRNRVINLMIVSVVAILVGTSIDGYFGIWLMGVVVNFLPRRQWSRVRRGFAIALGLGGISVGVLFWYRYQRCLIALDYLTGASATLVIYAVMNDFSRNMSSCYHALTREMSSMSYTLYLAHAPVIVFVAVALGEPQLQPNGRNVLLLGLLGGGILGYAYLVSRMTESRTERVRQHLRGWTAASKVAIAEIR
jgi:peptidoglycan/LPS O-acetylase OafA/YrhL